MNTGVNVPELYLNSNKKRLKIKDIRKNLTWLIHHEIINHCDLYQVVNSVYRFLKLIDMRTSFVQDHQHLHLLHVTKYNNSY